MKLKSIRGFVFLVAGFVSHSTFAAPAAAPATVRVLTDRTESHLKPIFEAYEKAKGVKINAVFIDQGLLNRLESRPDEADVVITKDAELLELAKQKGLLQPFKSEKITSSIGESFRDKDSNYFVDAYRVRSIITSKARVKPGDVNNYEDLVLPKYKGKVCIRSGFHDYNVALFSMMMAANGAEKTKSFIKGLHANLAQDPKGGDRDQAKAIMEGKCDIAIMNSYYYPIMMGNPDQKAWAEAVNLVLPNQKEKGAFIMRSALGLTKAKAQLKEATELLEYMASEEGQTTTSNLTYQFPTNTKVPMHATLKSMIASQPNVKDGAFKVNFVQLKDMASHREEVVKILNEVKFDQR